MKTIADFKRKMIVGAKAESKLFWTDKEGVLQQQNHITDRTCTVSQSNSFALTMERTDGKVVDAWCDWPKKAEFEPIDENTCAINFPGGRLTYTFTDPAVQP